VSPSSLENSASVFPPDQAALFGDANRWPAPGTCADETTIRALVTDAIRRSGKSREVIAEEMSCLTGDRVTVRMLNSYSSAAAEQHRFPVQYVRAFCHATHDWKLLHCIAERGGFRLIGPAEEQLLELGRQYLIRKRAEEHTARLESALSGVRL